MKSFPATPEIDLSAPSDKFSDCPICIMEFTSTCIYSGCIQHIMEKIKLSYFSLF